MIFSFCNVFVCILWSIFGKQNYGLNVLGMLSGYDVSVTSCIPVGEEVLCQYDLLGVFLDKKTMRCIYTEFRKKECDMIIFAYFCEDKIYLVQVLNDRRLWRIKNERKYLCGSFSARLGKLFSITG